MVEGLLSSLVADTERLTHDEAVLRRLAASCEHIADTDAVSRGDAIHG